jgi:hypothetical protein
MAAGGASLRPDRAGGGRSDGGDVGAVEEAKKLGDFSDERTMAARAGAGARLGPRKAEIGLASPFDQRCG